MCTSAVEMITIDTDGHFVVYMRPEASREAVAVIRVHKNYELNFTEAGTLTITHGAG